MRLLFLLSQLNLILPLSSPFVQPPLCHHDESSALLQFKESFIINENISNPHFGFYSFAYSYLYRYNIPHPNCEKVASWTVEGDKSDCCSWDGVECDEATGHVIGLDLSSSCLYGSIRSMFSGQIPSGVSQFSKLSYLDLSSNGGLYTGSDLKSFVQNFTSLEELLLSCVNIWSIVPESLAKLSYLKTLDLGSCGMLGEFPTRIFQLANLRDLSIVGNGNLTGQLPEFHSNTSLEVLELANTGFYGKIPTSFGNLWSLRVLKFENCHFSGSIPHSLSNLTQLTHLSLFENNLEGTISSSFSELKSIEFLELERNNLKVPFRAHSLNLGVLCIFTWMKIT
jgi:Leucine-rich repeat (LRR) protein